jgi:transcriptional regulator with XRE-family HTH domain
MNANLLVAQNLRRRRIEVGLSQEALAHEAGVDRTYVSRIERNLENCTVSVLEKFALAIGCDIRDFFAPVTGAEPPPLKSGRKPK